ncbi:TPA: hypothetical protein ACGUMO_004375 [Vibrio vulnificus]|uniref:hypothetical protein n=1 Tax=Vibrio TaxID=662 RepID=UPI000BA96FFC|nr:hypothetical protein [Vibrio cholerae]EGR4199721.1 hypothetical protein [Vibrio cholerae]EGR4280691.1 hypothetical protein [Vibrio cholerae]EKY3318980.1 hypothetical protein [Vibrio cholerae]PAS37757.1 hypothetical protein CGT69_18225 [Vibrio cholerae]PAS46298.1 hypothetical protein CGT68_01475 [Vibrio cholerae]
MLKYFIALGLSIVLTLLCSEIVPAIDYAQYKDLLGVLFNLSAIVFAIIGAWIAVVFPQTMSKVFTKDVSYSESRKELLHEQTNAEYLSQLVEVVLASASVLMVIVIIQLVFPVLNQLELYLTYNLQLKVLAFGVVAFLSFVQLLSLARVVLANYFFLNQIRKKTIDDELDQLHK